MAAGPITATFANTLPAQSPPSDARQIDKCTRPTPPVRHVCVIGNSSIGAVYRAYKDGFATDGFEFSFFARHYPQFDEIAFEGTSITQFNFSSGDSPNMLKYDYFVVYGDLISPGDPFKFDRTSSSAHYSSQVLNTIVRYRVCQSKSMRIFEALHQMTGKPVFLLSKNISLTAQIDLNSDYDLISNAIAAAVVPGRYIPHPPTLLSPAGRPKEEFHKNAVNSAGQPANNPDYDNHHLNPAGGALMLGHILEYLRQS